MGEAAGAARWKDWTTFRAMWVVMGELATTPDGRHKLVAGTSLVTPEMVEALEPLIDDISGRFAGPAISGNGRAVKIGDPKRIFRIGTDGTGNGIGAFTYQTGIRPVEQYRAGFAIRPLWRLRPASVPHFN